MIITSYALITAATQLFVLNSLLYEQPPLNHQSPQYHTRETNRSPSPTLTQPPRILSKEELEQIKKQAICDRENKSNEIAQIKKVLARKKYYRQTPY